MSWSSEKYVLSCGCRGHGPWDSTFVGDVQACGKHGEQTLDHMSRILEVSPRGFQLGTIQGEETSGETTA